MATLYKSENPNINWVCNDNDGWEVCDIAGGRDSHGIGYDFDYINNLHGPLINPQEVSGSCKDQECKASD